MFLVDEAPGVGASPMVSPNVMVALVVLGRI
jgi:hypothetical protein